MAWTIGAAAQPGQGGDRPAMRAGEGGGPGKSAGMVYVLTMHSVLPIVIAVAMLATVGVLALGVINMTRRGHNAAQISNKLMQYRVLLQALALALFALFMLLFGR